MTTVVKAMLQAKIKEAKQFIANAEKAIALAKQLKQDTGIQEIRLASLKEQLADLEKAEKIA